MTKDDAIEIIKDVTWKDFGRHPDFPEAREAAIQALNEVEEYRAIGTPEEYKIAVEKQRPKKPINPDDDYGTFKCPNCNGLIFTEDRFETHKYCLLCGQALDWSDEE